MTEVPAAVPFYVGDQVAPTTSEPAPPPSTAPELDIVSGAVPTSVRGPAYTMVLTDQQGTPLSDLGRATQRQFALAVGSMATGSAQVPLDSDDADVLLECDTLLKVYEELGDAAELAWLAGAPVTPEGRLLQFVGRQITGEEIVASGGGASVSATWADPFWTLLRRLCGKSNDGYIRGTAVNPVDVGTIIAELVNATNLEDPSGLRMGAIEASISTYVEGWHYKSIGEAVAELAATLFGPDWRVRPIEPIRTAGALSMFGELDVLPTIGQHRPDAAFEHGDGLLNVGSYRRGVTIDGMLNRAFNLPAGFPADPTQAVMQEDDTTGQRGRRGLLEGIVSQDLTVDELRRRLLQHHIAVRASPQQTITFDPVRDPSGDRVPRLGIDFNMGDTVPFRASRLRDGIITKRIDVAARVYQYAVSLDNEGAATPQLTVSPS